MLAGLLYSFNLVLGGRQPVSALLRNALGVGPPDWLENTQLMVNLCIAWEVW